MMREEMAYRELAAIVDNEQRIAAPAAGTGCGFARASRLVAGGDHGVLREKLPPSGGRGIAVRAPAQST
jgi:hypothetical protein